MTPLSFWWPATPPLLLSRAKAFRDTEVGLAAGRRSLWMPGEQWGPWRLLRAGNGRHHWRVSEVGDSWSHAGASMENAHRGELSRVPCPPPHPTAGAGGARICHQGPADPEDTGAGSRLPIHPGGAGSPSLATEWFGGSLHPCGCWEPTSWLCFGASSGDYELLLNGFIRENMQMFFRKFLTPSESL